MEETKELQTMYKIFRCLIYLSLIVEFFEYAIDPALLDYWGGIVCDIHSRVKPVSYTHLDVYKRQPISLTA